jgi:hypothetical protein|tara:strand:- start:250 stop:630 length:381 start_codon:yes stop_codon:yes gene_type:complete
MSALLTIFWMLTTSPLWLILSIIVIVLKLIWVILQFIFALFFGFYTTFISQTFVLAPNLFVFFKNIIISLIRKLLEVIFDDNSGVFYSFIEFRFEHPGWALLLSITIIFLFFSVLNNEKLENDKKQ